MMILAPKLLKIVTLLGHLQMLKKKTGVQMIPNIYAQHVPQVDKKFDF